MQHSCIDRIADIDDIGSYTYGALNARADRFADALHQRDVTRSERVRPCNTSPAITKTDGDHWVNAVTMGVMLKFPALDVGITLELATGD